MIAIALAKSLLKAAALATSAATKITFDGKQFRKDIAHKGIARFIYLLINLFGRNEKSHIFVTNNMFVSAQFCNKAN